MDSSNPACATCFNRKRKAEDSVMVVSKRAKFMTKYYQQNFSMPDSVIFYIAKNPKTPELYLKMVKTCKYFFVKNPIIILSNLYAYGGKWRVKGKQLDLIKYNCKYWITDKIYASAYECVDKNIFSPIIPKLYQCDAKSLFLHSQVVSFNDLSLIISSAKEIDLYNVVVKLADSSDVPLEDIVAIAVNAKVVSADKPTIISKTMKELSKLPNFKKLHNLVLYNLAEVFDINEFYGYMKRNQHTKFNISFNLQISDAFKNRLETIIDEILVTQQFIYKPPVISFTGLDREKFEKLCQICDSH
uniref:Uncharacterized protein n=1 Tax=Panagrolaimus sp. PS1159 TaxID=55785 RepID=A0AC35FK84_9BILA